MNRHVIRSAILAAVASGIGLSYWWLDRSGLLATLLSHDSLRALLETFGAWGPAAVIGLMTVAIVVSPLPSAPIAVAAGAVYGHSLGAIYVSLGSVTGALIAFLLARFLGRDAVRRFVGPETFLDHARSQNVMMGLVFVARLIPFISFDVVSYAAGLTPLALWRFTLATLLGILPASFFLAHVGSELGSFEGERIALALVLLGLIALASIAFRRWRGKKNRDWFQ